MFSTEYYSANSPHYAGSISAKSITYNLRKNLKLPMDPKLSKIRFARMYVCMNVRERENYRLFGRIPRH